MFGSATADLDNLESRAAAGDWPAAIECATAVLRGLDRAFGRIDGLAGLASAAASDEEACLTRFATRFAAALTQIVGGSHTLSDGEFAAIVVHHRWINLVYSLSGFKTAEHAARLVFSDPSLSEAHRLRKALTIFPANVTDALDFDLSERVDPAATYAALLSFIGNRYCFQPSSYALRERALEWLPSRLEVASPIKIEPRMLVEPYMHCSYATTQRKHEVKAGIIQQMRQVCLRAGCREVETPALSAGGKPVIFVTTEGFGVGHSVYRTHSRSVRSLRQRFHVIGICFRPSLSPEVESCFDEVMLYPLGELTQSIRLLGEAILARRPAMILQLGVGMAPHTVALASLRLAPIQVASFAHTATTNSPYVDHMVLPADFVRAREAFTEPLLMLPAEAMPYALRADGAAPSARARARRLERRPPHEPVRIGLPASIMKHNPSLSEAIRRIMATARRQTEIHLFPLGGVGLARLGLERSFGVEAVTVHAEAPYPAYLDRLGDCDFFLCPFPYGNVNSIVDCVRLGLPGVCLDGDQPHAHADASLFRRAGLPEGLISQSVDEYVAAAVQLIDDPDWLEHCTASALAADLEGRAFNGDASQFCDALAGLLGE